jgi:hypothetical protein
MFRFVFFWQLILAYPVFAQPVTDSAYLRSIARDNQINKQRIQSLDSAVNELRLQVQRSRQLGFDNFINCSFYLDAAISTCNNLSILIYKESYRNKISALNNPAGNELGFNLQAEIQSALKPLLEKTRKTDRNKFSGIVESIINAAGKNTAPFSSVNIFNNIISMVGNLAVGEKKINRSDLENFIVTVEKYFEQYEKLYRSNLAFSNEMEKLKGRIKYLQADIKNFLADIIIVIERSSSLAALKNMNAEELMIRYFDLSKLKERIKKAAPGTKWEFPSDAIKTCKDIASNLQRLYEEYAVLYANNYNDVVKIVNETKAVYKIVDKQRLNNTLKELEKLYADSREADNNSLRMKTLSTRLELFSLN